MALAFLLAHRSEVSVYHEGVFTPEVTDASIDEWLQDPSRVSWKWVHMDASAKTLLSLLSDRLATETQRPVLADPLDSARALVSLAVSLPAWTQRTQRISKTARDVRTALLRASDPLKVIFVDLPEIVGSRTDPSALVDAIGETIRELQDAFPRALSAVMHRMTRAIDHQGELSELNFRAKTVRGLSGDFLLDAFAGRLESYSGSVQDMEGLIALAASKPAGMLNDHDLDAAAVQLAKWAFEFRRVEAMASVEGWGESRKALAVVFGGRSLVSATFDVATKDASLIQQIADGLVSQVAGKGVNPSVLLAALVEAGTRVLEMQKSEEVS